MPFLARSLVAHVALLAYFWLASFYAENFKSMLPGWAQTTIGLVYLGSLLVCLYWVDLIALKFRDPIKPTSTLLFYSRSVFYYAIILGVPAMLLFYKESAPGFLLSYGAFIFLVVLINHVDYALPSYGRYRRLFAQGRWGKAVNR
jgi:hypothetical protein